MPARQDRGMSEAAASFRTDEPLIHLPRADTHELDEVWNEIEKIGDSLPSVNVQISARAAFETPKRWPIQREMFILVEALTETLLDREAGSISPALAAQLGVLADVPMIPETMAMQIAFGRKMAEEQSRKMAGIVEKAQKRGLSVDEYVAEPHAANAIPNDKMHIFHGDTRWAPSAHRLQHGAALLRRVAGMLPVGFRPSLLCVISWLMWASGRRPIAMAYLAEATRIRPEHLLASEMSATFSDKSPAWLRD